MGRYRSRLEIVADILSVVGSNDAAGKTRIMYLANLSWEFVNRYLNSLMEAGLVSFGSSDRYVLTPRGRLFLKRFSEYSRRCEEVKEHLNDLEEMRKRLEDMFFNAKGLDRR